MVLHVPYKPYPTHSPGNFSSITGGNLGFSSVSPSSRSRSMESTGSNSRNLLKNQSPRLVDSGDSGGGKGLMNQTKTNPNGHVPCSSLFGLMLVLVALILLFNFATLISDPYSLAYLYADPTSDRWDVFRIGNWEMLLILPKHVALKGDNGLKPQRPLDR
ncbi:hypothetical protein RHGRI_012945 [Rhododendron griersonianum]|uniref:Uncharacterized protein n=1 Tax=Rhododendron griersonianum TaxID=479676 RepID=A0AAV6K3Q2_9ERIC|nr:hypothetical protein RHGRI_012945 [Rhododendron griersonianum]